jgi:hypothetical protein
MTMRYSHLSPGAGRVHIKTLEAATEPANGNAAATGTG